MCSTLNFETCQWPLSLPHQSTGKWQGSRAGGVLGVGGVGRKKGNQVPERPGLTRPALLRGVGCVWVWVWVASVS